MAGAEQIKPYSHIDTEKAEQVEMMFDRIAWRYDLLNHILSFGIDKWWRRTALRRLRQKLQFPNAVPLAGNALSVLDVATGTGDFALNAHRYLHNARITAIDLSWGMMKVGQQKAAKAGCADSITFMRADCNSLPFEDNTFDAITIAFGIRNFVNLEHCFAELLRVLKVGGRISILELSTPRSLPIKLLFKLHAALFMPLAARLLRTETSAYKYLPATIAAFPQAEALSEMLIKAGFAEVAFKRLTCGVCTLYESSKH